MFIRANYMIYRYIYIFLYINYILPGIKSNKQGKIQITKQKLIEKCVFLLTWDLYLYILYPLNMSCFYI